MTPGRRPHVADEQRDHTPVRQAAPAARPRAERCLRTQFILVDGGAAAQQGLVHGPFVGQAGASAGCASRPSRRPRDEGQHQILPPEALHHLCNATGGLQTGGCRAPRAAWSTPMRRRVLSTTGGNMAIVRDDQARQRASAGHSASTAAAMAPPALPAPTTTAVRRGGAGSQGAMVMQAVRGAPRQRRTGAQEGCGAMGVYGVVVGAARALRRRPERA